MRPNTALRILIARLLLRSKNRHLGFWWSIQDKAAEAVGALPGCMGTIPIALLPLHVRFLLDLWASEPIERLAHAGARLKHVIRRQLIRALRCPMFSRPPFCLLICAYS